MNPKGAPRLITSPKPIMDAHYAEARLAREQGRPVAWLSGMAPVEPLRAMGVAAVYPENHAAICGARHASVQLCEAAEARGYSADLCSYARCDIGAALTGSSPIGGLPRPDFLLSCSNFCTTVTKWYEALARHFSVPHIVIDAPFAGDAMTPAALAYVVEQLQELIGFLESLLHRPFDYDRLGQALALADQAGTLWLEILTMARLAPTPFTAFEAFIHMAPMVAARGTPASVSYYEALRSELEQRVASGAAAMPGERIRLLWGGIPIWSDLKAIPDIAAEYDACFVASEYANSWAFRVDVDKPLESMAVSYSEVITNLGLERRAAKWQNLIKDFAVDGFFIHSNRSCRPGSLGQYELKAMLETRTGVPGLIIDADMVDPRAYSHEDIRKRMETFLGMLKSSGRQHE